MLLSVLQKACVRILRFLTGSFFAVIQPIYQNRKVSKDNFSIIYLVHKMCELPFSTIQTHSCAMTLEAFILFTSAKVVMYRRLHNTFSQSSAQCVLLLLMHSFLNGFCLVEDSFIGLLHSSSSSSVSCHWMHLNWTHHIWRWLTSLKLRMHSRCSLV